MSTKDKGEAAGSRQEASSYQAGRIQRDTRQTWAGKGGPQREWDAEEHQVDRVREDPVHKNHVTLTHPDTQEVRASCLGFHPEGDAGMNMRAGVG